MEVDSHLKQRQQHKSVKSAWMLECIMAPPFFATLLLLTFCYSYLGDDILSGQDEGTEQVVSSITSQLRQGDLETHKVH